MGTQITVPSEHLQELRPKINAIAKSGLSWCIQPRSGEMTANITDGDQAYEALTLVRTAVAEKKKAHRKQLADEASAKPAKVSHGRSRSKTSKSRVGSGSTE